MSAARDPLVSLRDAAEAAGHIADHIAGLDEEAFLRDLKTRQAVERCFINIGEALNRLAHASPELAARIPDLRAAIAFRHILAHHYDDVETDTVWDVAHRNVPVLKRAVEYPISELDRAAAAPSAKTEEGKDSRQPP